MKKSNRASASAQKALLTANAQKPLLSMSAGKPLLTVGIDLGDRCSRYCIVNADGEVMEEGRIATTAAALERHFTGEARQRIAMECGTHSPWVSRLLQGMGHEVWVANARKLRAITASESKNDRNDAEKLARFAAYNPKLLSPIQHRSPERQRDLNLLQARDTLVRARTRPVIEQVAQLTQQIRGMDKQIEMLAKRYPEVERLRSVPGVGPVIATAYVLTLDSPTAAGKSRAVGAFLGLRPRQSQSGASDPQHRIGKTGNDYLRRLLVQAAQYVLGPFAPDSQLRRWGLKLAASGGKRGKK